MAILNNLSSLDRSRWGSVDYDSLIRNPKSSLEYFFRGLHIDLDDEISNHLTLSHTTLSTPSLDKWKQCEAEINPLLQQLSLVQSKIDKVSQVDI